VSNLAVGVFTVLVSDSKNCLQSSTFAISQPISSLSISNTSVTNVSCFGNNNGIATVTVTGERLITIIHGYLLLVMVRSQPAFFQERIRLM